MRLKAKKTFDQNTCCAIESSEKTPIMINANPEKSPAACVTIIMTFRSLSFVYHLYSPAKKGINAKPVRMQPTL